MLDIGFFELLVVGIVLIVVMGPERLPEVAKKAAFFIRKARQGMFRLRSEMQNEMKGTPFADLENAKREISDLKNDFKQFGRDLADSADPKSAVEDTPSEDIVNPRLESTANQATIEMTGEPMADGVIENIDSNASNIK